MISGTGNEFDINKSMGEQTKKPINFADLPSRWKSADRKRVAGNKMVEIGNVYSVIYLYHPVAATSPAICPSCLFRSPRSILR